MLLGVLAVNLVRLLRDGGNVCRARGSLRLLVAFARSRPAVLVVFLVSVEFLHTGIETWADDRIATGLERSLQLSRRAGCRAAATSTDGGRRRRLSSLAPAQMIGAARHQARVGAAEMTVFGRNYRIVATSTEDLSTASRCRPKTCSAAAARAAAMSQWSPKGPNALQVRAAVTLAAPRTAPASSCS